MTVFDVYIQKVAEYVEAMRARGREIRTFQAPLPSVRHGKRLPIRVGPGANPGIILRDDTSVELGNPEAGSSAFLLLTDSPSLLNDGRITLIGPDIKESAGKSLPFGQVLMVGGTSLADKDHEALQHDQIIGDQIEGYMARSMTRNIWSRVSKEVAGELDDGAVLHEHPPVAAKPLCESFGGGIASDESMGDDVPEKVRDEGLERLVEAEGDGLA